MESIMRVVYFIDKMRSTGGTQTHLLELVSRLNPERFEPSILSLTSLGDESDPFRDASLPIAQKLRERGIPLHVLGTERIYGRRATRAFFSAVRHLRRIRPDVVHTYLSSANVFGAAASTVARVPHLLTSRRDTGFGDSKMIRRALRLTNLRARGVIAVSDEVANGVKATEGIAPPFLRVIPNGIDATRFSPKGNRLETRGRLGLPATSPIAITVTHLTRIKGVDLLVDAARDVVRAIPDVRFLIVGAGNLWQEITSKIREYDIGENVVLLGERSDVPDLLDAADIFVLPSRSEGQPNSLLEAMATCLPVVATRVGGVPELLSDREQGLMVEPRADEIARATTELLSSVELAQRLGTAARQRVLRDFNVSGMVRTYEELYLEVAKRKHSADESLAIDAITQK